MIQWVIGEFGVFILQGTGRVQMLRIKVQGCLHGISLWNIQGWHLPGAYSRPALFWYAIHSNSSGLLTTTPGGNSVIPSLHSCLKAHSKKAAFWRCELEPCESRGLHLITICLSSILNSPYSISLLFILIGVIINKSYQTFYKYRHNTRNIHDSFFSPHCHFHHKFIIEAWTGNEMT